MTESVTQRKKRSFGYKIKKFADIYKATDEYLGEGSCGTVRTFLNVEKNKEFAVKIVENSCKRVRKKVLKEIEILHHCKGHPNITQLHEFYEEDQKFYLVFEKMAGLTLLDWMERHGGWMCEEEVSEVARGLATALDFLHHKGVAHRDLKLENILCTSLDHIHPIKVCDFDLSTDFGSNGGDAVSSSLGYGSGSEVPAAMDHFNLNDLASAVGSADYMAPEVVRVWLNEESHYSEQCDIWSLGVVLYILLCGYKPFGGTRSKLCCCSSTQTTLQCEYCKEEHFEQIKEAVVEMDGSMWDDVSEGAKDLISQLLVKDPAKRLTASQVLNHPWVHDAGVFTHTKSLPIPCHPIHKLHRSSEVDGHWAKESAKFLNNSNEDDDDNNSNTLVEDSLCNTLADRIFSLELEEDAEQTGEGRSLEATVLEVDKATVDGALDDADVAGSSKNEEGESKTGQEEKEEAGKVVVVIEEVKTLINEATVVDVVDAAGVVNVVAVVDEMDEVDNANVADKVADGKEKLLMFGSCDSGNGSGISLVGSPCILAQHNATNHANNPLCNLDSNHGDTLSCNTHLVDNEATIEGEGRARVQGGPLEGLVGNAEGCKLLGDKANKVSFKENKTTFNKHEGPLYKDSHYNNGTTHANNRNYTHSYPASNNYSSNNNKSYHLNYQSNNNNYHNNFPNNYSPIYPNNTNYNANYPNNNYNYKYPINNTNNKNNGFIQNLNNNYKTKYLPHNKQQNYHTNCNNHFNYEVYINNQSMYNNVNNGDNYSNKHAKNNKIKYNNNNNKRYANNNNNNKYNQRHRANAPGCYN